MVRLATTSAIIKQVYKAFISKRARKARAQKEIESAAVLVRLAKKFFTNKNNEFGKTIE